MEKTGRRALTTIQIRGGGDRTAKELLTELLLNKVWDLACDSGAEEIAAGGADRGRESYGAARS